MSDPMTDEDIRAAVERERKAHVEMQRIVGVGDWWGRRESPDIHIPADPERDSDLVIGRSLGDVPTLAAECLRRGEEIALLVSGIRAVLGNDEGRISTHYEGCEETHWRCGLRKLLREVER